MNMFHDLLKLYNITLVTSAVVSDNSDLRVIIARLLVRYNMESFIYFVLSYDFAGLGEI